MSANCADALNRLHLRVHGYEHDVLVRDLLADLMHFCAFNGKDFDNEPVIAREHFDFEQKEDRDEEDS